MLPLHCAGRGGFASAEVIKLLLEADIPVNSHGRPLPHHAHSWAWLLDGVVWFQAKSERREECTDEPSYTHCINSMAGPAFSRF
jgi:hypothetical protein